MPDALRIGAGNAAFDQRIREMAESVQARFRYHSIALPGGSVLPGLQTIEQLERRFSLFPVPVNLRGKRVLDIGAWDGWFSFECERRGADVVAVDCVELDTFLEAKELLGSKVEYLTLDVNELTARRLGRFDIVLFFGVLYHLRHPLLGLERVVELSTDLALVESFVIPAEGRPVPQVMEFYERGELGGQIDNWCGPTPDCLLAMCRSAGFARAELLDVTSQRASVVCRRHWPEPAREPVSKPPHLHSAVNNRTHLATFHPAKDEYLCCYFTSAEKEPTLDFVFVEVDGFGVPALTVTSSGPGAYQVNCLRPPGLEPGRHRVRVRIFDSTPGNEVEFVLQDESSRAVVPAALDLPTEAPELCSVEFQTSGDQRLARSSAGTLVCYFRSAAATLGASDVTIEAGGHTIDAHTVGSLGDGVWQANLLLRGRVVPEASVRIRLGNGAWSAPKQVLVP